MFDRSNVKDEPKEIEKETERLKDAKKPPDHVQHLNEKVDLFDWEFTREETWSWNDNNQGCLVGSYLWGFDKVETVIIRCWKLKMRSLKILRKRWMEDGRNGAKLQASVSLRHMA
ncbi:hypothetical protein L1987_63213 [Smallanthus sonchifolius]|uniref:Uncharacterized protein n=1 Tax=Smallanthus sonchifolius TaxID=185202 RepID=A0ACB9CCI6_9ASTR|nr:hypothetical protein L1987_63213 [Smallanthus sonchifolius]